MEGFGLAAGSLRVMVRGWPLGFGAVARGAGVWVYGCEPGAGAERDVGAERAGGIDRVVGAERGAGADLAGADWRAGADEGRGAGAEVTRGAGAEARGAGADALGAGDDARGAGAERALEPEDRPVEPPRCAVMGTASKRRAAIANRDRANMNPQRRCGRFAPATRIPEAGAFMWLRTRRLRASQQCVDILKGRDCLVPKTQAVRESLAARGPRPDPPMRAELQCATEAGDTRN